MVTNSGYLWDTTQQEALERGNLIHLIMSLIKTKVDVDFTFSQLESNGTMSQEQSDRLKPLIRAVVSHPVLSPYFKDDMTIYNEKDIITDSGLIVRPDRIVIDPQNKATIIDYKTGQHHNPMLSN